jgi:hypothetical protein
MVMRLTAEAKPTKKDGYKEFAVDCFSLVWSLMKNKDRTKEDDRMVHAPHASRFHSGEIGTPTEFERDEWQISRVYSVLKKSTSTLSCQEMSGDL